MKTLISVFSIFVLLALASFACASDYKLGPEDVISVAVLRHAEFSGEFFVSSDGLVSFPGAGEVLVTGKSLSELSSVLMDKLSSRLRSPEVSVTLKSQRQLRVYVLGAVKTPGIYDAKPGWRITECLTAGGGILGDAADCRVTLLRASSGEQKSAALGDILKVDSKTNFVVEPNDLVSVDTAKTLPVYVMGRVKNPGMYDLREDRGVLEAIALAGGALDDAALSRVMITSTSGKSEAVDLSAVGSGSKINHNPKLSPGDLIVVPESTNKVAVLGYVSAPGYFTLKDGQKVTLSDVLGLANGVISRKGQVDSILVLRMSDGKQQRLVYDLGKFLKNGDVKQNPEIQPGDIVYVPAGKNPSWEALIRTLSSVSIFANAIY